MKVDWIETEMGVRRWGWRLANLCHGCCFPEIDIVSASNHAIISGEEEERVVMMMMMMMMMMFLMVVVVVVVMLLMMTTTLNTPSNNFLPPPSSSLLPAQLTIILALLGAILSFSTGKREDSMSMFGVAIMSILDLLGRWGYYHYYY